MHMNQIIEARALATVVPQNITAADTAPWMVVQYVPTLGSGGTAATVEVTATTMVFLVDGAAPAGADAIGTAGVITMTAAAFDTMGELVDAINAVASWRAYLVGALRSDASVSLLVAGAASCIGDNGLTLASDTSDTLGVSTAISGEKFINNGKAGHVKDADDQCENSLLYAAITMTNAGAANLQYYTGKQGSAEVQVGSDVAITSATKKEQGEANLAETFVTSKRGERLIVRYVGATLLPTAIDLHVDGKTAVLKNDRMVTGVNY